MSFYSFAEHPDDLEVRRLRLIEAALDPESIARLDRTGIRAGWRCLELGPGAGSLARWMGRRVGETGEVAVVDLNPAHVSDLCGPPYRVLAGDFLGVDLAGSFDLAHCRYVLVHNRQRQAMLQRLCSLLRPGGLLLVEEPDFTSARWLNPGAEPARQRVNDAICAMFERMDLDPAYGLRLPADVTAEAMRVVQVEARLHLHRGGETLARMMSESTQALRERYVATGKASPADIERYIENAADPDVWSVYYSTVAVLAEKPGESGG